MAGLTWALLGDAVRSTRKEMETGWVETQELQDYVLYNWWLRKMGKSVNSSHEYEWSLRRAMAEGSAVGYNPFDPVNASRDTYDIQLSVIPKTIITHLKMLFDIHALQLEKGTLDKNKLWSMTKMAETANNEAKAKYMEVLLRDAPRNTTDRDAILGLGYWGARSQTSGGVFVEQLTPARNGVYRTLADGTVTATVANQDTSLAANSRLRHPLATHRGSMNKLTIDTLHAMTKEMEVSYLAELMGEKSEGDLYHLMDQDFAWEYQRLMADRGNPSAEDYYPEAGKRISTVPVVPVPSFRGLAIRPIYTLRPRELAPHKFSNMWDKEYEFQVNPFVRMYPKSYTFQVRARDLSMAIGVTHGSF